jgi:hypothetical protein
MGESELGPTGKSTQRYALIRVPIDSSSEVVGTFLRPDRPITVGKRGSDRWMAYSVAGVLALFAIGEVITSIILWSLTQEVDRCLP